MEQSKKQNILMGASLFLGIIVLDQVTKYLAIEYLSSTQTLSYWADTVRLQHSENPGAFLSLGSDFDPTTRFWVFTVGASVLTLVALWVFVKKSTLTRWNTVSFSLILAGGIGNIIDRVIKGTVTDFLNIGVGPLRTGIFNVADMAIMVAVGILMAMSFIEQKQSKKTEG